jgi:Ni/Co efflux regulator RcnB
MLSKSRFLKSTIVAALVGLAGVAAVTPASARDFDRHGGYHRDRDSGWDRDRDSGSDRHDRFDRGRYWRHHRHHFHGWY